MRDGHVPRAAALADAGSGGGLTAAERQVVAYVTGTDTVVRDAVPGPLQMRTTMTCLFASPHPGDQAFVMLFDQTIADYRLFNYILDIVPRVPPGLGYAALPLIRPQTAEAAIRFDIGCNHHVICYCAMLDYEETINGRPRCRWARRAARPVSSARKPAKAPSQRRSSVSLPGQSPSRPIRQRPWRPHRATRAEVRRTRRDGRRHYPSTRIAASWSSCQISDTMHRLAGSLHWTLPKTAFR
jgi:hypothetical protein